jgi:hypothetical protein
MALHILPLWNTSFTGDLYYLQVSGWKGCTLRPNALWRVEEEVEKTYCEELELKFGDGRVRFKPLVYWD